MRTLRTRAGATVPALGLGTWCMGENAARRAEEVRALQLGLDLGMTGIDTAEMYADGGAEQVTGEAIRGRRDEVYLVSKVLPQNASRRGTVAACERSLRRLGTDRLDLYLLHWPGGHPLAETVAAFEELRCAGKVREWGVSNFDVADMDRLAALPEGGQCTSNQVLYNLTRRGIERRLLPLCQRRGVFVMAYSPLEQARLSVSPGLQEVASRHGGTPMQVALAWTLRHDSVMAIPKATRAEHVRDNRAAADLDLTAADLALLDEAYPPPAGEGPLETL